MSHLLKILILLLCLLLSFSVETHSRKKKNKYVLKRTKSVELLQIEPDPVAYEAVPDRESLGLLLPDIFFSMSHTSYIHGFDMSHHQGDVDWKEVAKDPNAGYIFLKATEGANFVDRKYKHNFREAKKAGLKVGSYHFFRPNVSGEEQYNLFISNIDYKAQDLLPIIDVEIHPSRRLSLSTFYKRLDTLLELVTKKIGRYPIIYTGKNFYNKYFANGKYKKYPFMIASYTLDEPVLKNNDDYIIWQFTATGSAKGVRGDVDISRFRGNHTLNEILYK
jgi:lysozyme